MKTLWNAVSFLAVVNLLMAGLFIGWLVHSDRLDLDRVYAIREVLATTITAEKQAAEEQAKAEIEQRLQAIEAERRENPFPPAMQQVGYVHRLRQSDRDRERRTETELEQLRTQLERGRMELARQREAFEQEKEAWRREQERIASRAEDEQFQQAVRLMESIPAKQAKDVLVGLMRQDQTDDAVAYLDAMKPFNASKVLREFKSEAEQPLATDLLERLKNLGSPAGTTEISSDADASADPP